MVKTRIVDLSGPITHGMWDYNALRLPGVHLPSVAVVPLTTIDQQGNSIHSLHLTSLTGVYVETPGHMVPGAPLLKDVGVDQLVRPAKIMRLPPAATHTLYRLADFEAHDPGIEPGDALIIDTGWGRRWGTADYVVKAPAFAWETLDWLVRQPYSILATDTPVAECLWWNDVTPPLTSEQDRFVLGDLYKARPHDLLLVAPLVNLDQIQGSVGTLIALPIRTPETPAAPCRAIFLEGVRLSGEPAAR